MNNIIYRKLGKFDISFLFDGDLYIDNFVKEYPDLELKLLKHELKHVKSGQKFRFRDFAIDTNFNLNGRDYITLIKHKPLFVLFSPFAFLRRIDKDTAIDWSRVINFILILAFSIWYFIIAQNLYR